jgi:hypothetical protein
MKTQKTSRIRIWKQVLSVAALAVGAMWLAGCSTPVYQRGDRAADSAQVAAAQVQTEMQALAGTLTTLTNLVEKPAADLRPGFQAFSASLDGLIAAAQRGEVRAKQLARSNDVFFAAWDKQLTTISNVDIRTRSAARRNQVSTQFRTINDRYGEAREQLSSMISYLEDIRRALSTDLTLNGIEAVKPLVVDAGTTARKVQSDLAQANDDLAALSVQMSSSHAVIAQ